VHGGGLFRCARGEDFSVAAAVTAINPGYRFSTLARFREALDALVVGLVAARRAARDGGTKRSSGSF
jgi:hypothetical protein